MKIVRLEWDSVFFRLNIGKLEIDDYANFDLNILKKSFQDFDLIYIYSNYKIDGLKLVDNKEVFILNDIKNSVRIFDDTVIFDPIKHSYDQLLDLALQSGKYSRFNIDENFRNNEYQKLYTEWIDKSITKEMAIDIIIKIMDNRIVGFTTLCEKTGLLANIGLVAVDSKFRGQGIARELIERTICEAHKIDFKSIQVVTQHNNIPAVNLYTSIGFKSQAITNIYHYWNL